jgi:hypothetical protein
MFLTGPFTVPCFEAITVLDGLAKGPRLNVPREPHFLGCALKTGSVVVASEKEKDAKKRQTGQDHDHVEHCGPSLARYVSTIPVPHGFNRIFES